MAKYGATPSEGQHVKIRHVDGEWSMTVDGEVIENVRLCEARFAVDSVDTVRVEFCPGSVEIEADDMKVEVEAERDRLREMEE